LTAVLEHFLASGWRADVVLVTGDLIQDGRDVAYEYFRQLLGQLALPVYCLPGNHDVRKQMRLALADPPFDYCAPYESHNWLIANIDSCIDGSAGGGITRQEYARLNTIIRDTTAAHVMVCLHHPPVPMGSAWLDTVRLEGGDAFLRRLEEYGRVRIVAFGHVHQDYDVNHGSINVIATPSTCRQFEPGSERFAVDTLPPAYRRFCLYPDGHFSNELIWVNSA
jgi:Icc protein